jgi:hypothetical protein
MIEMRLTSGLSRRQALAGFLDRPAVMDKIDWRKRQYLARWGGLVRQLARRRIRPGGKKGIKSEPGEPPRSHTGLLRDNIFFAYDRILENVVVGPVRLSGPGTAPHALEHGGLSITPDGKVVYVRPRPYMEPALQESIPETRKIWAEVYNK